MRPFPGYSQTWARYKVGATLNRMSLKKYPANGHFYLAINSKQQMFQIIIILLDM